MTHADPGPSRPRNEDATLRSPPSRRRRGLRSCAAPSVRAIAAVLAVGVATLAAPAARAADYDRLPIDRYLLIEPSGAHTPYLSAIGGRRQLRDDAPGLPTGPLLAYQLSGQLAWLRPYDTDRSGRLDPSEYTHAWMLKAVEVVTGRSYPIAALAVYPSTAQLSRGSRAAAPAGPRRPAPRPATGTMLSEADERLVRNVLDDPRATGAGTGNALVDAAQAIQDWYAPAGGDGGSDGGGGGGRGGSSGGSW